MRVPFNLYNQKQARTEKQEDRGRGPNKNSCSVSEPEANLK